MTGAGRDIRSLVSKLCGSDIEEIESRRSKVTRGSKSGSKHLAFSPLTAGGGAYALFQITETVEQNPSFKELLSLWEAGDEQTMEILTQNVVVKNCWKMEEIQWFDWFYSPELSQRQSNVKALCSDREEKLCKYNSRTWERAQCLSQKCEDRISHLQNHVEAEWPWWLLVITTLRDRESPGQAGLLD